MRITKLSQWLIALCLSTTSPLLSQPLNVISFNIRMDTPQDGNNQWTYRKDFVANLIQFYQADIVGAQEVLHHQLTDLLQRLPDFDFVGVGREDGKQKGEYCPILYNKLLYEVLQSGTFWLSQNKDIPGSIGWDAACQRIASWAIFRRKTTNQQFFALNTHLDHIGTTARRESATLLLQQINLLANNLPTIVTGDFNATTQDEPILLLTSPTSPNALTDSRPIARLQYGPEWTFHNFGKDNNSQRQRIDFILIKGNLTVQRAATLAETLNNRFPSDHCPILATLLLPQ